MTGPVARAAKVVGVGVVIVLALVVLLTALRTELPRSPGVMSDALGPDAGESVDDYLARAGASLADEYDDDHDDDSTSAGADAPRWALVSADRAWTVSGADAAARALPRVSGLYAQIPVEGVAMPVAGQTLAEPVAGETGRTAALGRALDRVAQQLGTAGAATAGAGTGVGAEPDRAAAKNALTVSRIRSGEPAVIALVVRGTTAQLREVAQAPGVRAVEALPPDAVWERFAVRPLLPQQTTAALPLPDTGPVPAA